MFEPIEATKHQPLFRNIQVGEVRDTGDKIKSVVKAAIRNRMAKYPGETYSADFTAKPHKIRRES
jgi:hypothetical protein